ncbi:golgin subfamily A member 6D-like isoform X4 [Pongo pygmaeus]|uniref:golgin subfamily A member 6D-like isoform X4 n=1 Tax=Pongo pygmaeus TaxID=9600 RepID=UPI0023E0993F|nr:golgin subfamily A member 6D-like isoform X4 [Pongo pygmaeus]XP_054305997.1 golgin subfamily A member 6D-like isoform X4 [Pongo pygmaeus]
MWPQPYLPPHPMMLEETRQNKLAAAKKKLKEYQQRKSSGVPEGVKTKKKKTGSSPETTTSGGCHPPGDSQYQGLAVGLESSSVTINQLNENIESLKEQKKQVEHQLEEAKKANNEIHKAQKEQLETINVLTLEKADLKTTLYHTKRAARHFEEESKDLAGRLQYSLQRIQELERALCAVSTQQQEEDRSSSCSEAVLQRQLQQTIKERALLNAHVTQMTESLKQVQLQKDEYAEHIKGERARWQERMRKMSVEARTLKEEKKSDIHRIQELERSLSEFKNQMAEPPSLVPPAVTSVVEQLQDEAKHLRQEVEGLEGKLQSQVENNQALSLLSKEQKQRLQEQEEMLREQKEWRVREQKRLCEQNEMLQEQQKMLGEQGERLRKQEQRLRKQEERLRKGEERLRKQEKRLWDQEERLWKKEERLQKQEERLQKQEERLRKQERLALSQNHKLDKQLAEPQCSFKDLNNENKSALHLVQQVNELQEKLDEEHLEAASQQNQQLETQLSLMALPGEGDGGGHLDSEEEEVPLPVPNIPEDLESWEATSSFMDLPKEKADGKEQVETLEHGFIQPSGATDGMRESFTGYESQGAVPITRHQEMEDVISLAQKEEEMKVKLLELQELVLPLVGNHEGQGKFLTTAQNPADEPAPGAPAPQELGADGKDVYYYKQDLKREDAWARLHRRSWTHGTRLFPLSESPES